MAVLLLVAATSLSWWLRGGAKIYNTAQYRCTAPHEFVFGPKIPSHAEIYIGGWIDSGNLTIEGFPSHTDPMAPLRFEGSNVAPSIAAAYYGDWYGPVKLKFTPTAGASCFVKIVYLIG